MLHKCAFVYGVQVMKMFDCVKIEGSWWLSADMRLQCYHGDWFGYALYALIVIAVYILGLPVAVFALLFRHRQQLFVSQVPEAGSSEVGVAEKYGFLYQVC